MTVHILVVDDHPVVRQCLRRMLEMGGEVEVVEAASGLEAMALAEKVPLDLALLDIKMPGMNGIEAIRLLKERLPTLRTIALTLHGEEYASLAMAAGADAYLPKDMNPQQLLEAFLGLAKEGPHLLPQHLLQTQSPPETFRSAHTPLPPR